MGNNARATEGLPPGPRAGPAIPLTSEHSRSGEKPSFLAFIHFPYLGHITQILPSEKKNSCLSDERFPKKTVEKKKISSEINTGIPCENNAQHLPLAVGPWRPTYRNGECVLKDTCPTFS